MAQDWSRYPRPPDDTGAGVHGGANAYHPLGDNDGFIPGILDEMHRCGLRWVKLLDADGSVHWGHVVAAAALWIAVPITAGLIRLQRTEIK